MRVWGGRGCTEGGVGWADMDPSLLLRGLKSVTNQRGQKQHFAFRPRLAQHRKPPPVGLETQNQVRNKLVELLAHALRAGGINRSCGCGAPSDFCRQCLNHFCFASVLRLLPTRFSFSRLYTSTTAWIGTDPHKNRQPRTSLTTLKQFHGYWCCLWRILSPISISSQGGSSSQPLKK